jgi:hypothetical protein
LHTLEKLGSVALKSHSGQKLAMGLREKLLKEMVPFVEKLVNEENILKLIK